MPSGSGRLRSGARERGGEKSQSDPILGAVQNDNGLIPMPFFSTIRSSFFWNPFCLARVGW